VHDAERGPAPARASTRASRASQRPTWSTPSLRPDRPARAHDAAPSAPSGARRTDAARPVSTSTLPSLDEATIPADGEARGAGLRAAWLLVPIAAALLAVRAALAPALLAVCVAGLVSPIHRALARRALGRRRAAAMATACVVGAIALPAAWTCAALAPHARALVEAARAPDAADRLARLSGAPPREADAAREHGAVRSTRSTDAPSALVRAALARLEAAAPTLLASAGGLAIAALVFVMTLYYALSDGEAALRLCRLVSPLPPAHLDVILTELLDVARGVLLSVVVTSILEGGAAGVAYAIVGMPGAAALTVATMLAAVIPLGTALIWAPVAIVLWQHDRPVAALTVAGTGVFVIGAIDHLLRPQLARLSRARFHPLLALVGMVGGVSTLGAAGLFVGPLAIALALSALRLRARGLQARPSHAASATRGGR
jgi:predicted PurR-regulated permease PerM